MWIHVDNVRKNNMLMTCLFFHCPVFLGGGYRPPREGATPCGQIRRFFPHLKGRAATWHDGGRMHVIAAVFLGRSQ